MKFSWKKTLSLLLVLTMLLGLMPAVFASNEAGSADEAQIEELLTEEPDGTEVTADPGTAEIPEALTEPDPPGDPEEEPSEPIIPEEPEAPEEPDTPEEPEEEPEDETEAEESPLPYGFPGMGEDYTLSEEELAAKLEIAGLPAALASLTAGVDYAEGELLFITDQEAYAQQVADAYDAELLQFCGFFARLRLRGATVLQAVECAADPEIPLPAVEPNWLAQNNDIPVGGSDFSMQGEQTDWDDWWSNDPLNNAYNDPALHPHYLEYQYHHTIMGNFAVWGAYQGFHSHIILLSDGVNSSDPEIDANVPAGGYESGTSYNSGTHIAKLIAGELGNGKEGAGVAPRTAVISDNAGNSIGELAAALNNRAGSLIILVDAFYPYTSSALEHAVENVLDQGGIIIAPMGDYGNSTRCYPAAYDGVIAVAATDNSGAVAPYSCTGSWCDISAPGNHGPYGDSTRYAAALVAGAAALYFDAYCYVDGGYIYGNMGHFEADLKKAATKGGAGAGIVNAANLFGGRPQPPTIHMDSNGGVYSSGNGISVDGYGRFWFTYPDSVGPNMNVLFTLDGSAPAMKDGEYSHGIASQFWDGSEAHKTNLLGYFDYIIKNPQIGKTYTIKAVTVSGMGIPSKVATLSYKLVGTTKNVHIELTGPERVIAGQSAVFKAVAINNDSPRIPVAQDFEWDIDEQKCFDLDDYALGATLKNGKITTMKGRAGYVDFTVRLKNSDAEASGTLNVYLPDPQVASLRVTDYPWEYESDTVKSLTLMTDDSSIVYLDARDKYNNNVNSAADCVWTSSNESVLRVVDFSINLCQFEALSAGSAVLKATARDGSNKSVSIKVTVRQSVNALSISPKSSRGMFLAPGGSVSLKANVSPANAANKSVTWSYSASSDALYSALDQKKLKKGVLSLNKAYEIQNEHEYVTVVCTSNSNPDASDALIFYVIPKVTEMYVAADINAFDAVYDKNGTLKSVTLCTPNTVHGDSYVPLSVYEYYYFNGFEDTRFNGYYNDGDGAYNWRTLKFDSSRPGVAYVSNDNGALYALSPGSTKITVTAGDGARKFSFTVKVVVPISGIDIISAEPGGSNTAAYGKSFRMKAFPQTLYGKPTDAKLKWSIMAVYCEDGSTYYSEDPQWADFMKQLSISQSGVLKTKAGAATVHGGIEYVCILVEPLNYHDTSNLYDTFEVYLGNAVSKIEPYYGLDAANSLELSGSSLNEFHSVVLDLYDKNGSAPGYYVEPEGYVTVENYITVTSSNPNILSAWLERVVLKDDDSWLRVRVQAVNPQALTKTQNAKVTVRINDGTGKTFTFTVRLSP